MICAICSNRIPRGKCAAAPVIDPKPKRDGSLKRPAFKACSAMIRKNGSCAYFSAVDAVSSGVECWPLVDGLLRRGA